MANSNNMHPNLFELIILNLAYSRFFDIFDEFMNNEFWNLSPEIRLLKLKNCFEIYTELLKYEPIKGYINYLKKSRPPQESFIANEYFLFIRNVLSHFPYFCCWDDIYIIKETATWNTPSNSSILKFIEKYSGNETVKYRIWNDKQKKYTYMDINFPNLEENKIFIKNLVSEKDGMLFCMTLMKQVLKSQIEKN